MEFHVMAALGILLICGYWGGKFANWLNFPRVTGYILAGIIISPSFLGIISKKHIFDNFSIVTDIGLAVIAFSIGGSLRLASIRQLAGSIFWITITQALGAFVITFLVVMVVAPHFIVHAESSVVYPGAVYLSAALIIGVVAVATAPAAVLAIVHELRAKGPLTTTLLAVVALDDAVAVVIYAFVAAVVEVLIHSGNFSCYAMVAEPLIIIVGSVFWGVICGLVLVAFVPLVKRKESVLIVVLGTIFLGAGLAEQLGLSSLLTNMVVGFFAVNVSKYSYELLDAVTENIEDLIFALFFTLAGAHFDMAVIKVAGTLALIITLSRFAGKFYGTKWGAKLSRAPRVVQSYLGYGLLPTAGVAVGLVLTARNLVNDTQVADIIVNAVLGAVIINELIAPPLVKYALIKAGEDARSEL